MSEMMGMKLSAEKLVAKYAGTRAPDLRDVIVTHYASMVERIARRFGGSAEPVEDLTQVGFIGLLNALELYDPQKGVKFSTYATHLIAGEIKHHLRDRGKIIKEPAWLQELNQRMNRVMQALAQELGRQPTAAEIAAQMRMTEEAVTEVLMTRDIFRVVSIDAPSEDEEGDSPYDLDKMEVEGEPTFDVPIEDKIVLETAIIQLKEIERKVIQLFFYDGLNQTEIAHQLRISCNYVSHILRHSVQKLRKILVTEDLKDRRLRARSAESEPLPALDDQTGLFGAEYFQKRISEEAQRASLANSALSAIVVEFRGLDRLRNFYGDMTVGEFLGEASGVIRAGLRNIDILCRIGEYSFGILIPYVDRMNRDLGEETIRRLDEWVAKLFSTHRQVTFSTRRANYPQDADTYQTLMRKLQGTVDEALPEAA